jgi:hypothetical protein
LLKPGIDWVPGGYLFATRTRRPVEPRKVHRSFVRVSESAGLRPVRLLLKRRPACE